jgi:aminoglycoside phosphotransferase (APT) family kinase protein
VSEGLVGRPVHAVLIPPQLEQFASLTGVDVDRLEVNVTGWNKLVLLGDDRAFLFPRAANALEWFERELTAFEALAATDLRVVPRVLARWEDEGVYPMPFAAVTRLFGTTPTEPETFIEELGRCIARWHDLEPPDLPGARPPRHHEASYHRYAARGRRRGGRPAPPS